VDGTSLAVILDLDAKHPMQLTKVHNLDMLMQAGLELLNEVDIGGSDGAVIDMHSSDGELTLAYINLEENSFIDQASFEA
jgi:hypothetical protein